MGGVARFDALTFRFIALMMALIKLSPLIKTSECVRSVKPTRGGRISRSRTDEGRCGAKLHSSGRESQQSEGAFFASAGRHRPQQLRTSIDRPLVDLALLQHVGLPAVSYTQLLLSDRFRGRGDLRLGPHHRRVAQQYHLCHHDACNPGCPVVCQLAHG